VLGHFRYPSGLEVAARNTMRAFEAVGWQTSCRDVPTGDDEPGRDQYLGLHPFPVTISQLAPEPFGPECYELAGLARCKDTYRIGYWYWELEAIPDSWRRHASWLHEIWAPTRFVADALRGSLPLPIVPMLPAVAAPPVVCLPRSRFGLPDNRFLFLTMFDMASSFERKNPLGAVAAFRRAFPADAPVALAIKVTRGDDDPAALEELRRACRVCEPDRIVLLEEMLSAHDQAALHAVCDAHVSLHRSEGFGLALAEAMALQKPVIATGYSGNLDFMDESNSLLVSFRKVPVHARRGVYPPLGEWAEPSIEHAAELMGRVVANRDWAREVGERAAVSVRERLAPEAAGRRMTARLEAIRSLQHHV
jgi:glycosyltransferase involved in cell wall biosynthesis